MPDRSIVFSNFWFCRGCFFYRKHYYFWEGFLYKYRIVLITQLMKNPHDLICSQFFPFDNMLCSVFLINICMNKIGRLFWIYGWVKCGRCRIVEALVHYPLCRKAPNFPRGKPWRPAHSGVMYFLRGESSLKIIIRFCLDHKFL